MARISPKQRQASGDRRETAIRTSPSRFQGFNPGSTSTFANISSRPLPAITHSQSSPPSPNSLTAHLGSPTAISANMAFNPKHQRAVSDMGPLTYTPKTGKVRRGLKGKPVHPCHFPGCGKLFSRAEHVRRHAPNHNPGAVIQCGVEGCGKTFKRKDLCARHMEKKQLSSEKVDIRSINTRRDAHMQSSPVTMAAPEPQGLLSPASLNHRHASVPAVSHEENLMSIGSLVQPGTQHHFTNDYSLPVWCEPERGLVRGGLFAESPPVNTDDTMVYSSPDSCRSPASDVHPFQFPQRTPIMDQSYSESFYQPQIHGSPLTLTSTASDWAPLQAGTTTSQMLPISLEGDILQTVAIPVPIPFSGLDGNEWYAMRRELNSAPGVISGNDGMEIIDTAQWQDCFECYWKHFHPIFPIVHRPTFFAVKPIPLMSGAMVAIGSQYDTRPNAKAYSLTLLEACLKLLEKRNPITIRSRISDIQAMFLLEYLSKYRSKKADVAISPQFKSLYGTFIRNRHWASKNPLAVFNTLSEDEKPEGLKRAYSFWVESETRRRILQASFLLDVQQSTLFQQPLAFLQANLGTPRSNIRNVEPIDLPFPCPTPLWECGSIEEWAQYAKELEPLTLSSAAERIIHQNDITLKLDPFQSNLILSYALLTNMRSTDLEQVLEPFIERVKQGTTETESMRSTESCNSLTKPSHTLFAYHALLAAYRTPLKALLIVSGESWLFNRKLAEQSEYQQAKKTLRLWASDTDELKKAVWHAAKVLEFAINHPELGDIQVPINSKTDRCPGLTPFSEGKVNVTPLGVLTQWDNDFREAENSFRTPECLIERSTILPQSDQADPITSLHANWTLYICALICWAYGADSSITADNPPFYPPASPRTYVSAFMLLAPSWSHVSRNSIPDHIRRDTSGLLEYVRTRWLQPDQMGGLLNEGARVLQRLNERNHFNIVEDKKMWDF